MRTFTISFFLTVSVFNTAHAEDLDWVEPTEKQIEHLKLGFVEASNLKDPFSVQFRSGLKVGAVSNGTYVYCGFLNAKNSHGAYTGWAKFVVIDTTMESDGSYSYGNGGGTWSIYIEDEDDIYATIFINMGCEGYRW